jgi:hypothetical protein
LVPYNICAGLVANLIIIQFTGRESYEKKEKMLCEGKKSVWGSHFSSEMTFFSGIIINFAAETPQVNGKGERI